MPLSEYHGISDKWPLRVSDRRNHSQTVREIKAMLEQGKDPQYIADELCVSLKYIQNMIAGIKRGKI